MPRTSTKKKSARDVVASFAMDDRMTATARTVAVVFQLERVRCGKANCRKCGRGGAHGPYWRAYWRAGKRTQWRYVGKHLPEPALERVRTLYPAIFEKARRVAAALPKGWPLTNGPKSFQ